MIAFEGLTLNPREFSHAKHVYIAWVYLKELPYEKALERYVERLYAFLSWNKLTYKFNYATTRFWFERIRDAMHAHPHATFDEIAELVG